MHFACVESSYAARIRPCGSPEDRSIMREARRRRPIRCDRAAKVVFLDAGNYQARPINDLTLIIALNARLRPPRKFRVDTIAESNFLFDTDSFRMHDSTSFDN